MQTDKMREAFETFCDDKLIYGGDRWMASVAWKAAYAAGMERAAGICDAQAKAAHATASWESHSKLRACADAIRAEIKEG